VLEGEEVLQRAGLPQRHVRLHRRQDKVWSPLPQSEDGPEQLRRLWSGLFRGRGVRRRILCLVDRVRGRRARPVRRSDRDRLRPGGDAVRDGGRPVEGRGQLERRLLGVWEPGSEDGQFSEPEGIAISGDDVFVADTGNHRIQRFDRIGTHELSWGTFGNGDLQFKNPAAIAVDAVDGEGGTVYVADTGNNLIKRYTRNGVCL
jgi:hypothetical protein